MWTDSRIVEIEENKEKRKTTPEFHSKYNGRINISVTSSITLTQQTVLIPDLATITLSKV